LEKKHDKGKALSILAHQLGRAVYYMLKRTTAFDMDLCLRSSGSSAGAPGASLDAAGLSLQRARSLSNLTASVNATACIGLVSLSPGDCLAPRSGSVRDGESRCRLRVRPLPRA
jgi:hypothetical protein